MKDICCEDLESNEFRAIVYMEEFPDRLLYVTRIVDGEVLTDRSTKETVVLYDRIKRRKLLLSLVSSI